MKLTLNTTHYQLQNTLLGNSTQFHSLQSDIEHSIKFAPLINLVQTKIGMATRYLMIVNFYSYENTRIQSIEIDIVEGRLVFDIMLDYTELKAPNHSISELIIDLSHNSDLHLLIDSLLRFQYTVFISNPLERNSYNPDENSFTLNYDNRNFASGVTDPINDYPLIQAPNI
ncbi:hypothetical protein [Tenacibaculum xiamenense]|uniref:hypothetical protein n=1 Tax=Tenacibaculum xiamenense TaxID=1261553 RepID=UPI0038944D85